MNRRLFVLTMLIAMLVFGAWSWADCNQSIYGGGGGGSPTPTPTPDPYAWISNLPPPGQTAKTLGEWQNGSYTVFLWWYGTVYDQAQVINQSVVEDRLASVGLMLDVQSQSAWQWSGFAVYDNIYSQQSFLAGITVDSACQGWWPGPPAGYDQPIVGCNNSFPPIDTWGMNAVAHFAPMVTFGGDVTPISNYVIDYRHKLTN